MFAFEEKKPQSLPGIKRLIGVVSGKGGVGKSTVAVNLAAALAKDGHKVGLIDADIYGPSVPKMLGIKGKPEAEGGKIVPAETGGIQTLSMGLLIEEEKTPAVWRGPMASKAMYQLFQGAHWDVDTMIVDLPPGTGDIHLTFIQKFPVDGIIVVTTPQDVALIDARKAVEMYRKLNIPILGLVENMSYFQDPASGNKSYIFGEGGGKRMAEELGIPLLGEIPLEESIRVGGDEGKPAVLADAENSAKGVFSDIAEKSMGTGGRD